MSKHVIDQTVMDEPSAGPITRTSADSRGTAAAKANDGQLQGVFEQLWDRLELRDRSLIVGLESVVQSVRLDGTALVEDVAKRYVEARARLKGGEGGHSKGEKQDAGKLRTELLQTVLPSLEKAEIIGIRPPGLGGRDAVVTIRNHWLRITLLEAGMLQLDWTGMQQGGEGVVSDDEWSRLWFAVQRFEWTTLAVVSASADDAGAIAAKTLADAGRQYHAGPLELIDATDLSPSGVEHLLGLMDGAAARGAQLIIALESPLENPSVIPIARRASLAVLAVRLGASSVAASRRILDVVGRDRFAGSIALR